MARPSENVLRPYISEMQLQYLKDESRIVPCHTNRASEAGHPCARFLVYARTSWQQRQVPPPERQALFTLGNDIEDIVLFKWFGTRLSRYGLEHERPKSRDWKDEATGTTGHLDCYLNEKQDDGSQLWIPGEVKGVAVGTWDEVGSHADMLNSTRPWVRKWAVQLPMYCFMDEKPYGRYIFFQKETGKLKDFPVVLDDCIGILHEAFERLKVVNMHVQNSTLPDRFYEPGPPSPMCEDCDFGHLCLPGSSYDNALRIMDNDQVAELLRRHDALKSEIAVLTGRQSKELAALKRQLGKYFSEKPRILVGGYLVESKKIEVKPSGGYSYWKWDAKKA